MEHLTNALNSCYQSAQISDGEGIIHSIAIDGNKVTFTIQDGPIGDVGINGIQVTGMLEYVKEVYKSLNAAYPCRENSITITKIEEAIHWQDARTKDRETRGVEGQNKE